MGDGIGETLDTRGRDRSEEESCFGFIKGGKWKEISRG